jgi:hypothetical protein
MIKIRKRQKCSFKQSDRITTADIEIPPENIWLREYWWYVEKVIIDDGVEKVKIRNQYFPSYYFVKVESN